MYTVLINEDNSVTITNRERIMQYSKLVDTLRFISPKTYGSMKLEPMSFLLQYVTPISKQLKFVELKIVDNNYKDEYLMYELPIDTDITKENGKVEMFVSFKTSMMNADGKVNQYNRVTDVFSIDVIPTSNWFVAPDSALDNLTQMFLANKQMAEALLESQSNTYDTKADNLELDAENGYLWLTANGNHIGQPIKISNLGDTLAELTEKGLVKVLE